MAIGTKNQFCWLLVMGGWLFVGVLGSIAATITGTSLLNTNSIIVEIKLDARDRAPITLEENVGLAEPAKWAPVRDALIRTNGSGSVEIEARRSTDGSGFLRICSGEPDPDLVAFGEILNELASALLSGTNKQVIATAADALRSRAGVRAFQSGPDSLAVTASDGYRTYIGCYTTNEGDIFQPDTPGISYSQVFTGKSGLTGSRRRKDGSETTPTSRRAVLFLPYFFSTYFYDIKSVLEAAGFSVDVLTGNACTLEAFLRVCGWNNPGRVSDYGVIVVSSHGGIGGDGRTYFVLGEEYNVGNPAYSALPAWMQDGIESYDDARGFLAGTLRCGIDHYIGRLRQCGKWTVDSRVISAFSFPQTIVIVDGCRTTLQPDMANAFFDRGASAYLGWDVTIHVSDAKKTIGRFFDLLWDTRQARPGGTSLGDAHLLTQLPGLLDGWLPPCDAAYFQLVQRLPDEEILLALPSTSKYSIAGTYYVIMGGISGDTTLKLELEELSASGINLGGQLREIEKRLKPDGSSEDVTTHLWSVHGERHLNAFWVESEGAPAPVLQRVRFVGSVGEEVQPPFSGRLLAGGWSDTDGMCIDQPPSNKGFWTAFRAPNSLGKPMQKMLRSNKGDSVR